MVAETMSQQAYRRIHDEIMDGRLALGSRLSELSLSKRLGIGRMPVREAIRQLQDEGVLRQVPRYGTIVREPTREDIVEAYELREALEVYAVGKAVERVTLGVVEQLEGLLEQMASMVRSFEASGEDALAGDALMRHLAADKAFHTLLVHAAGNGRIAETVARTGVLVRILATRVLTFDQEAMRDITQFHSRILDAVKRRDAAGARQLMSEHIAQGLRQMLADFDRVESTSDAGFRELPPDVRDTLAGLEGGGR